MNLTILTPEKEVYNGQVKSVQVPGTGGKFEVLNGHAPIVSSLSNGTVKVTDEGGNQNIFEIEKGFIEVLYNEVSLLITGLKEK
jgi:F-type H+-transporting ATPase subunit epsilon